MANQSLDHPTATDASNQSAENSVATAQTDQTAGVDKANQSAEQSVAGAPGVATIHSHHDVTTSTSAHITGDAPAQLAGEAPAQLAGEANAKIAVIYTSAQLAGEQSITATQLG